MTGLPDLLVELDDGTGSFPYDITEYVHLVTDLTVTRGRGNEFDSIDPSSLSITLRNNQGHFTLGSPTFGIFVDQMIRVTETVGATSSARFTGYVQNWPTTWVSGTASLSLSTVNAVDLLARLERRQLRSMLEQEILLDGPHAYYTLGEASGAAAAGDTSGNTQPPLVMGGSGDAVAFGNATGPVDGLSAATFVGQHLGGAISTTGYDWTAECFVSMGAAPLANQLLLRLGILDMVVEPAGSVAIGSLNSSSGSAVNVADGSVHHVAIVKDATGGGYLYVDGILTDFDLGAFAPLADVNSLQVGGTPSAGGEPLAANVSHVVVFDSDLSAGVVAGHASAADGGFAGESSDARVERIATYANVTDVDLESGVATVAAQSTGGSSPMAALAAVADTEGGALFIDGAGALVFQSRMHRVESATSTPVLELDSSDVGVSLTWSADKNYLTNYGTGTRPNGAEQVVVNQDSIDIHEQYPTSVSLLAETDTEVKHALQWQVLNYGEVKPRITQVEIDLLTQPDDAIREAALGLEIGDRVTISGMPSQAPVATADLIVEGWTEDYSKDAWTLTLNTISADHFKVWRLEDPVYGVLEGPFTRLHY